MFPIVYNDIFLEHQTGKFHPENPGRLTAICDALYQSPFASQLQWLSTTDREVLSYIQRVHDPEYVKSVGEMCDRGGGYIDGDTPVSWRSYEVALKAVNAWLDGVDLVLETNGPVFALTRPPGHHARPQEGMGFCVFNNCAIAAFYALDKIDRVAILDWDVHHGNGTQEAVWNEPKILFVSSHQAPFYPGTGSIGDRGEHENICNFPLSAGTTGSEYLELFQKRILPLMQQFKPDLLIVSAGFDANHDDPIANLSFLPVDYGAITKLCLEITPKILFGLEGGYEYVSLSKSVCAVIESCITNLQLV